MISLICIALAAICNSIMDTVSDRSHFEKSIFSRLNPQYWFKGMSWVNKYKDRDPSKGLRFKFPFGWISNFLDSWHLFKMLMLVFICLAVYSAFYCGLFVNWWVHLICFYVAWNGVFEFCYQKLWIKK